MPLITPALFSHRTPPNREKRETSKTAQQGPPLPRQPLNSRTPAPAASPASRGPPGPPRSPSRASDRVAPRQEGGSAAKPLRDREPAAKRSPAARRERPAHSCRRAVAEQNLWGSCPSSPGKG